MTSLDEFAAKTINRRQCRVCSLPPGLKSTVEENERRSIQNRIARTVVVAWLKTFALEEPISTDVIYKHVRNDHMEPTE